jgi:hypothetical protein
MSGGRGRMVAAPGRPTAAVTVPAGGTGRPERSVRLDLRYYGPLCLVIATSAAFSARRPSSH